MTCVNLMYLKRCHFRGSLLSQGLFTNKEGGNGPDKYPVLKWPPWYRFPLAIPYTSQSQFPEQERVRTSCDLARKKKERTIFFPPKRAVLRQNAPESERNKTDISKCRFGQKNYMAPRSLASSPSHRSGTHTSVYCQI